MNMLSVNDPCLCVCLCMCVCVSVCVCLSVCVSEKDSNFHNFAPIILGPYNVYNIFRKYYYPILKILL